MHFRDGKLSSEPIDWEQAIILVQLGLLPDHSLTSQHLIERTRRAKGY